MNTKARVSKYFNAQFEKAFLPKDPFCWIVLFNTTMHLKAEP